MKAMLSIFILSFALAMSAQGNLLATGAKELAEAFVKSGGKKAAKELVEFGGEKAIKETLEKAAKEGGEELAEKTVKLGKAYGLKFIKAVDSSPKLLVNAFDDLPKEIAESAIMAIRREPDAIARLISQHGNDALRTVAKHRGTGVRIVEKLGDDGVRMAENLAEKQGIILARHADDITKLPAKERTAVFEKICKAPAAAISFLEKHPKTLLTAAAVGLWLEAKDDILGVDETIFTPDGNIMRQKKGFFERMIAPHQKTIGCILAAIGMLIVMGGAVKIWGCYRRERIKVTAAETKAAAENLGSQTKP